MSLLRRRRLLEEAWDRLYGLAMDWVFRPVPGVKTELVHAYEDLPPQVREVYDDDVEAAFRRAHGPVAIAFRRAKPTDERALGGASLTTVQPRYMDPQRVQAYAVPAEAVLMHWNQPGSPLATRAYGHERELILKPDAEAWGVTKVETN